MTTVEIVAMTGAHIDALLPYERDMFGAEAWSAGSYRAELADTRTRCYLAAVDAAGELLGWAGVMVIADAQEGSAEILTVGTVPAARRRGIGRRLLAALLDEARDRGATEAFLEVRVDNAAAIALYDADGFDRIGIRRGYYENGRVDAVTMRRSLPDPGAGPAADDRQRGGAAT